MGLDTSNNKWEEVQCIPPIVMETCIILFFGGKVKWTFEHIEHMHAF